MLLIKYIHINLWLFPHFKHRVWGQEQCQIIFFKSTGIIKWQTFLKTALLFFKKQSFPSANELCSCAFHPAPSTSSPGYINTDSPSPTHFCTVSDSSTSATGRAGRMVSNRSADAVSFNFPHSLSSLYSSLSIRDAYKALSSGNPLVFSCFYAEKSWAQACSWIGFCSCWTSGSQMTNAYFPWLFFFNKLVLIYCTKS